MTTSRGQASAARTDMTRVRRTRRLPLLALVGAAVLLVLAATALWPRASAPRALACSSSVGAGEGVKTGLDVGQCAPDFALPDIRGKRVRLASFRGHPVLLHFWAVRCATCAAEYPDFARVVRAYQPKGLAVLAVDAWGEPQPLVQGWQDTHHLPATLLVDPSTAVPSLYNGTTTPTTYVIDRAGRVAFAHTGPLPYADFARQVSRIM